ncbi:pp31 [Orgyia pseudotsugata single capsid nuclopolyhedrovirus]|nr:pp31 [Orgyia pseudotsugata single capsid nuclopolyhedrovirus]
MVGHSAQTFADIVNKYESSALNKSNNEINTAKIKLFEKKKMPYRFTVVEVHNFDKRVVKRGKKIITNNKYILFNSWYTKNRKSHWLNSHDMWNYMKTRAQCKLFIDIFDYIEKLGKSVKVQQKSETNGELSSEASDEPDVNNQKTARRKKNEMDVDQIKESNDRRSKMYEEFYRVLTVAFTTDSPPATSPIYDFKFTRAFVDSGVQVFKSIVNELEFERTQKLVDVVKNTQATSFENVVDVAESKEKTRKRKHSLPNSHNKKNNSGSKHRRVVVDEYAMVSDNLEDSQLSD